VKADQSAGAEGPDHSVEVVDGGLDRAPGVAGAKRVEERGVIAAGVAMARLLVDQGRCHRRNGAPVQPALVGRAVA
jgi:hypothetical protein